jgi:hypothetical protein
MSTEVEEVSLLAASGEETGAIMIVLVLQSTYNQYPLDL